MEEVLSTEMINHPGGEASNPTGDQLTNPARLQLLSPLKELPIKLWTQSSLSETFIDINLLFCDAIFII